MSDKIVPYLSRINHEFGTRKSPYLLYVTKGGKSNSLIFHFKEDGKYFQYRQDNTTKNSVTLKCIYKLNSRSNKCPANIVLIPLRPDLIYAKIDVNGRKRFFLNFEAELTEKSWKDWKMVKSNEMQHSIYCTNQVPLKNRSISQFVLENGTGEEIKNEKRKISRFGPGQPLQRQLRRNHTQDAIQHGEVSIKKIAKEMNFHVKGSEFLAKITNLKSEEKSSRYHQSKSRKNIDGVDSKLLKILRTAEDICADAIEEPYIHLDLKTVNFTPIFLKSELFKLNHKDIFCDGTFSVARNSPFSQIYIFSIIVTNGGSGVFSYPILMFFMHKKSCANYVEILNFIKKIYSDEIGSELTHKNFHSDAELAFVQAVNLVFPESNIYLCSVHILRCFMKNFKSKVDTKFFENPSLLKIWRVLAGSIFLPLDNNKILSEIRHFLKVENKKLPENLKQKFKDFRVYLDKFYFNTNAPFSPSHYRYFDLITTTGNFSCSTNALESINRKLKDASGSGFLSFSKACRVIRDFKSDYLLLYEDRVINGNLNKRKKSTLRREVQLEDILDRFVNMSGTDQISKTVGTAFEIAIIDKFVSLTHTISVTSDLSTATSEDELDQKNFGQTFSNDYFTDSE